MHRLFIAWVAAVTLAAPTVALADQKPKGNSHPKPSSYAPGPHTNQHVYGSPIETHHATGTTAPRAKISTKHSKTAAHHAAPHAELKGHQPPPAPAPR